jgi:hypothetical protein
MDFYAVQDQVLALLRERVTDRALKVKFPLDDEALEALRDELIEAQQLALETLAEAPCVILPWLMQNSTGWGIPAGYLMKARNQFEP